VKDITIKEIDQPRPNIIQENVRPWLNLGEAAHYTISGTPISLKRPRFGLGKVYDSQKREKFGVQMELKSQHDYISPFKGPLQLDVTFFMPLPQRQAKKKHQESCLPHFIRPDIDNLLKWLLDNLNSVIIKDDAQICTVKAQKVYSKIARTELSITRLENNV
jgi:Holliday junction resolvase RusA-like endonuclease